MSALIQVCPEAIDVEHCSSLVRIPENGGECHFIGTVRNNLDKRPVLHLDFEAYEPMAIKEMTKIKADAIRKFDVSDILIHHRIGRVEPTGIAVLIIVVAPHRSRIFEACKYVIDTLKEKVPIWKKEVFADGEVWVSAHP